ncbi:hypothetical protein C8R45DRAFT_1068975 [Mycena sanguinolenta]|nr:hypothetical protein C8R45DRAFT_1068975 [Mycena sanguinolenta]
MSIDSVLNDPTLPPELEHGIFETAALACPTSIRTLMLVAKRVKCWVEPLLYRVVFLKSSGNDEAHNLGLPIFTPGTVEQKPYDCFRHVRHLFIDDTSIHGTLLQRWLLACTGTTNLYAQFFYCMPDILPSLSSFTNIRYLTVDVRALTGTTIPLPLFLTVTHLELLDFTDISLERVCPNISLIPQLTHLALNPNLQSRLSHAALCANAQLKWIVFLSPEERTLDGSPLLDDSRFVWFDEHVQYFVDWLHGALFGEDYWSLVDAFLAARQAGEIPRSRYRVGNGRGLDLSEEPDSD